MSNLIYSLSRKFLISTAVRYPCIIIVLTILTFSTLTVAEEYSVIGLGAMIKIKNSYHDKNILVATDTKLKKYILFSYSNLAKDILNGEGEYLDSLYLLLCIPYIERGKEMLDYLRATLVKQRGALRFSDEVVKFKNSEKRLH